jgi:hypothetical protein
MRTEGCLARAASKSRIRSEDLNSCRKSEGGAVQHGCLERGKGGHAAHVYFRRFNT